VVRPSQGRVRCAPMVSAELSVTLRLPVDVVGGTLDCRRQLTNMLSRAGAMTTACTTPCA
jgi:hypothetical protein